MVKKGSTEVLGESAAGLVGCLVRVLDGDDAGETFELSEGAITVGAADGCDVVLSDNAVSSRHLSIAVAADGLRVSDLGSTNGTFYLGSRLSEAVVPVGAVLRVGRTRLALRGREPGPGIEVSQRESYGTLLGTSAAMRQLYATLERIEAVDYAVLVLGETGAGKELVAREIHRHSKVAAGPYEILDCGAVAPSLLESELFGHVKGAFTGADQSRDGAFARAAGGTLFVDEVGELPVELQPKLLRALETSSIQPVGASKRREITFRLVAATHRDLEAQVAAGAFREDLFFRLNVVPITVPPLRERREDIPTLVRHFLGQEGDLAFQVSDETLELFTSAYDWPGNVRELYHAVARIRALGTLPEKLANQNEPAAQSSDAGFRVDPDEPLSQAKRRVVEAFEREYIVSQLERTDGNIAQAARLSDMDRAHFKRLMKRHGL